MPGPLVVGMQPQEGMDQTYGELGQGLYAGTEISANMRIHPSRTFLPGQTYTPEVRASSVLMCARHAHHSCLVLILRMCMRLLHVGWLGPHKQCIECARSRGAGAGPGEA